MEDRKGIPFVGPAGRYMRRELKAAGLDPYDAYYLNAVSCWPRGTPDTEHVLVCKENLVAQWNAIEAEFVLVVGEVALKAILPHATSHTRSFLIPIHGKVIFPIYHPSYILFHNPSAAPAWKKSLLDFKLVLDGFITLGAFGIRCVYCRKVVDRKLKFTCKEHAAWWRKDQLWKIKPPTQMELEL